MSDRVFLDTNVLVYGHDDRDPTKRDRAHELLADRGPTYVLSTQVLQELFVTLTRKLPRTMSGEDAAATVADFTRFPVVTMTAGTVLDAIDLSRSAGIALWDALIVRAALEGGCSRLLTEDMQHGRRFGRLLVENPFRDLA